MIKGHVEFDVGAGLLGRSAPVSAGGYVDFPIDDAVDFYGYYSSIRIYGDPDVANCCNTPFQLNYTDFDSHGGTIALHLRGLTTGQYDVKVLVRVIGGAHKRGRPSKPAFTVWSADKNREHWKRIWHPELKLKMIKPGSNDYGGGEEKELTIRLNYESGFFSSSSDTILVTPFISFTGNKDEYVSGTMSIYVLEIKKVK